MMYISACCVVVNQGRKALRDVSNRFLVRFVSIFLNLFDFLYLLLLPCRSSDLSKWRKTTSARRDSSGENVRVIWSTAPRRRTGRTTLKRQQFDFQMAMATCCWDRLGVQLCKLWSRIPKRTSLALGLLGFCGYQNGDSVRRTAYVELTYALLSDIASLGDVSKPIALLLRCVVPGG